MDSWLPSCSLWSPLSISVPAACPALGWGLWGGGQIHGRLPGACCPQLSLLSKVSSGGVNCDARGLGSWCWAQKTDSYSGIGVSAAVSAPLSTAPGAVTVCWHMGHWLVTQRGRSCDIRSIFRLWFGRKSLFLVRTFYRGQRSIFLLLN